MNAPLLQLSGIRKNFGGFAAVDGIEFDVPRGSISGLIGPNGAGKTTLFNVIAGMTVPDDGAVILDGTPLTGRPPHQVFASGLARTFQIPRPFPAMTVLENLMIVPRPQVGERFWNNWLRPGAVGAQEVALRAKAEEVLDFCNLSQVAGSEAQNLSGGQHKLLELARILMADPKIILLDEPAAGVNPSLMRDLVDKILALNEQGYTFLIIEHNMDVVMSICDPIFVMAQGKLIYQGNAAGVRADQTVLDAYLGEAP